MPRLSKIGAAALAAFGWTSGGVSEVTASYLQVAGGGGSSFGGGGAGGFLTGTTSLDLTQSYTVTVGAGGAQAISTAAGTNGGNSSITGLTASVGGGGGGALPGNGVLGGSGGGGVGSGTSGGAATSGQGNAGGAGTAATFNAGGGGGGSGGVGGNSSGGTTGGNAGIGTASSISGTSVTYAGGGSGASTNGGGQGSTTAGGGSAANLGGGGNCNGAAFSNGGSGVVIISYPSPQKFGGGVVTSSGGNTIHTFTTSGTLSPLSSLTARYLIVAGGGGGSSSSGGGGGGGAGGLLSGSSLTIDTNSIYAVTVGAGGAGGLASIVSAGSAGSNSSFSIVSTSAVGGGQGVPQGVGGNGGSGGGGGDGNNDGALAGGTGTSGQGNNGGSSANQTGGGGGGAGAGAVGGNGNASGNAGNGGNGASSDISGSSVTYAGGGGGGQNTIIGTGAGTGGSGGGGNGGKGAAGANATGNGSGGGGAGRTSGVSNYDGGSGSSGIVIISYPGSTQQMAGGTVTVAGGNVIHTFTSSGYLTPIVLVNNSLRFRASNNAYLNRTPASTTNQRTFTWSGWVKRGALGGSNAQYIFSARSANSDSGWFSFYFNLTDTLNVGGWSVDYRATTQVFRDPSAWYHLVLSVDTTQATASNRVKVYVNGSEVTAFSTTNNPTQNFDYPVNSSSAAHSHGSVIGYSSTFNFDGYQAEVNFIDGQALTPNSFGTSNGLGVWQPIRYGGSYGTNGFYLPFTASQSYTGIFNGTSQYLSVAANAAFNFTGNFTIECFFNTATVTNVSQPTLFTLGDDSNGLVLTFFSGNFYAYIFGVGGYFTSVTPPLNQWVHVAWVRVGSTNTLYINGVARATATASGTLSSTGGVTVGRSGSSGSSFGYFQGSVSNFRLNNTALYTANFTPSTNPLTAVSGTQLLTLQNATFVDNSTNAFTVTNNGSTPTAITYPFAYTGNTVKDFGPAGNNWTTNNIGTSSGSTLDTMTDVPTLTSATAGNYAVLNPLAMYGTNAVISNANLTSSATSTSNDRGWASTIAAPNSGKWYAEFTFTSTSGDNNGGCGIMLENGTGVPGDSATTVSWRDFGTLRQNSSGTSYGSALVANDVVIVAYDAALGRVWFGKNGTWFASGDPATNANPSATGITTTGRFATYHYNTTAVIQANFGQRPFAYTPPTDFKALNTFNLPTPTIGATASTLASQNFNAVLYSGNNSTQTITVGFQPDFMWSKCRNVGRSHRLIDSVRGLSYQLFSESVDGGNTYDATSYVSSITSTSSSGFAITNSGTDQYNTSGQNYVSWTWKANGAAVTNTAGTISAQVSSNPTSGFSVVTYSANGSTGTVGHGLTVGGLAAIPSMIIVKKRNAAERWIVFHTSTSNAYLYLNETFAADTTNANVRFGNNTVVVQPTNTLFTIGSSNDVNGTSGTYVAYCFAQVAGYSAFGSYTGNGSTDGPFVYLGFRPRWVLIRNTAVSNWVLIDTSTSPYNVTPNFLNPNTSGAEVAFSSLDITSNGFKLRNTDSGFNTSSGTYIYAAFAETPLKFSNAR